MIPGYVYPFSEGQHYGGILACRDPAVVAATYAVYAAADGSMTDLRNAIRSFLSANEGTVRPVSAGIGYSSGKTHALIVCEQGAGFPGYTAVFAKDDGATGLRDDVMAYAATLGTRRIQAFAYCYGNGSNRALVVHEE